MKILNKLWTTLFSPASQPTGLFLLVDVMATQLEAILGQNLLLDSPGVWPVAEIALQSAIPDGQSLIAQACKTLTL